MLKSATYGTGKEVPPEACGLLWILLQDPKRQPSLHEIMAHSVFFSSSWPDLNWHGALLPRSLLYPFDWTITELKKVAMKCTLLPRSSSERTYAGLFQFLLLLTPPVSTFRWTIASVIVIGSSAQFKIFIDAPGLDLTPTERPVDQSPTGFAKQGPRPEDRRHPQKFQRRKRKQYDRGIQKTHGSCNNWQCSSEDTHSKPREGERDKPKTPTQSPGKEKEKETGSRRNKTIGYRHIRGRIAVAPQWVPANQELSHHHFLLLMCPSKVQTLFTPPPLTPLQLTEPIATSRLAQSVLNGVSGGWFCHQFCDGHWLGEDGRKWDDLISSNREPINNVMSYGGRWWLLGKSETGGEGGFIDGKKTRGKALSWILEPITRCDESIDGQLEIARHRSVKKNNEKGKAQIAPVQELEIHSVCNFAACLQWRT
ncbi:hypothetical protein BU17DRAFT_62688 [Hysterangium stoloniferum]|nr:hypothetical protein BU17DRAFT_62688 [Hysterangium stoloniferum]